MATTSVVGLITIPLASCRIRGTSSEARSRPQTETVLTRPGTTAVRSPISALFARTTGTMALAMAISGAFLAPTLAAIFVLTGARARPGAITETFAWLTSSFLVGSAAGAALGGTLTGNGSGVQGYALAGAIALGAAALWVGGRRRRRATAMQRSVSF